MDGVNNHRTRAVRVKKHVPRANTSRIAVMNNAKGTTITSARLDPKKTATVSPVAKKGKTDPCAPTAVVKAIRTSNVQKGPWPGATASTCPPSLRTTMKSAGWWSNKYSSACSRQMIQGGSTPHLRDLAQGLRQPVSSLHQQQYQQSLAQHHAGWSDRTRSA